MSKLNGIVWSNMGMAIMMLGVSLGMSATAGVNCHSYSHSVNGCANLITPVPCIGCTPNAPRNCCKIVESQLDVDRYAPAATGFDEDCINNSMQLCCWYRAPVCDGTVCDHDADIEHGNCNHQWASQGGDCPCS